MSARTWDAYALRYATVERRRPENFIGDFHDEAMTMDYFVWFLQSEGETVLVDTGFDAATAARRARTFLRCPIESLRAAGVRVDEIRETVITHAHYDHAGNLRKLPRTTFHLQDREMAYATGREMRHAFCRHAYDADDVCDLVRANFEQRVAFHDGDYELRPGVTVHWVGGHTRGLQILRVRTKRGWVVLASDAAHYVENLRRRAPFTIVVDVGDMLRGWELIESLADSPGHIVAGHDPATLRAYRAAGPAGLEVVSLTDPS